MEKKIKSIDLHTHTIYSDGEYTPNEVIEMAIKNNIGIIAITDHDTILGLDKIDWNKYQDKIKIIKGIELSVKRKNGRMHILGYDIDDKNSDLINELKIYKDNSIMKVVEIINYLNNIGIYISEDEKNSIIKKIGNVGRPEIAKILIEKGYVKDVDEAFDKYLIEAYDRIKHNYKGHTYEDAITLIKNANGIPVLAHPTSLKLSHDDFEILIKDMIRCGLMGIEVYHPDVSEEERPFYLDIVSKYKLLYSAGSDFHGENVKPDIKIGKDKNKVLAYDASILKCIK